MYSWNSAHPYFTFKYLSNGLHWFNKYSLSSCLCSNHPSKCFQCSDLWNLVRRINHYYPYLSDEETETYQKNLPRVTQSATAGSGVGSRTQTLNPKGMNKVGDIAFTDKTGLQYSHFQGAAKHPKIQKQMNTNAPCSSVLPPLLNFI